MWDEGKAGVAPEGAEVITPVIFKIEKIRYDI